MAKRKKTQLAKAKERLEIERLRNESAQHKLEAKQKRVHLQFLNKNLRSTRKRQRGWTHPGIPERDMRKHDRQAASTNARQKVEESSVVAGLMQRYVDNIVGSGFELNMVTDDADWNRKVQMLWKAHRDKLDIRRMRRWGRLQRMWMYRKTIDGDVGIVLVDGGMPKNSDIFLSYLQTIEAERIYKDSTDSMDTGIDYDRFGRPKRFYVGPRIKDSQHTQDKLKRGRPVSSSNFIFFHNFPQERAERQRGVSALLQDLNAFEDFEEIIDAMIQKVKNESFMGLKFEMQPAPDGTILGSNVEESKTAEDGTTRKHLALVPGMNINAEENESVDVIESKSPNTNFVPFIRLVLRFIGTPLGLPLEMLLLDMADTNFSGGRAIMEMAKKRFRVEQDELAHISSRMFEWWLARQIKLNELEPPKDVDAPWAHQWNRPGWPYLDPQKEAQANQILLGMGVTTRQNIISETSAADVDDIAVQLGKEQEIYKENNVLLTVGQPGQATSGGNKDEGDSEEAEDEQEDK